MPIAEDLAKIKSAKTLPMLKILTIDIETSPSLAYVWSLWRENIPLDRLIESGEVLCFAAKWYGQPDVIFHSIYHDGKEGMLTALWALLDEADILITYNGKKFDIPHVNRELLLLRLTPPSPYNHIDLYQVVRSVFRFASNKLDHIAQQLELGKKVKHRGLELWIHCMTGTDEQKEKAWAEMREYNCQDVVLTEDVYDEVLPWIKNHPTVVPDITGEIKCPRCGSDNISPASVALTPTMRYDAYMCSDCGSWSKNRTGTRISELRSI